MREASSSRTLARLTAKPNLVTDEYFQWNGTAEGWSPWGGLWKFHKSLLYGGQIEDIYDNSEQLVDMRPDHLQKLFRTKISTSINKKSALMLHTLGKLIPDAQIHVWTDGSKKEEFHKGSGGWCWSFSPHSHIGSSGHCQFVPTMSSFQAECLAMWQALKDLRVSIQVMGKSIAIMTDSRSLTTHLEGLLKKPRAVKESIYAILEEIVELYEAGATKINIV